MKKRNLIRILSMVLAMVLCFSVTAATAFAVEEETPETPIHIDESDGDLITFGTSTFTNSTTITLNLSSGNWSADFNAVVTGNAGAKYFIEMTRPGGTISTFTITSNSGTFTHLTTLIYASAGTYTFEITRISGSASPCSAIVEIRD